MKNLISGVSIKVSLVLMTLILGSCYEKFDVNSYKPKFTISGFSAVDQIEPSSLVAYWALDGNLVETVSNTSMTNKATTFVNGFKGQALSLDVANKSYTTFDPSASITGLQSFTISFWVNPKLIDVNNNGGIDGILGLVNLSNPTGFWGNIDWFVENNNGDGSPSNNAQATIKVHILGNSTKETWLTVPKLKGLFGSWTNHTLTYDAPTSKFIYYVNGSSVVTATSSWTGAISFSGSGSMVFGAVQFQTTPSIGCCGNQDWASYLTGYLDEIRIYNKALSSESINALVVLQGKGK
jgi:hypothetical protein